MTLKLENMRGTLIRQEETIIFGLIERAQFKQNADVYKTGAIVPDYNGSFLDYFLHQTEIMHAKVRRYTSPEEHPFFNDLPAPILEVADWNADIVPNDINVNPKILDIYINRIIPDICAEGDCGNYGSSATCDVTCLQAISKRIHYGKYIAEAKFLEDTPTYTRLIQDQDADGIMSELVNKAVEQKLYERVKRKTATYGHDPGEDNPVYKIEPSKIAEIYRKFIIPLTCKVEVDYLLRRLEHE